MSLNVSGPRANIQAIETLTEAELKYHLDGKSSWHDAYKNSSYIFIGGLDFRLNEGDVVVVFSQWGEPIDVNLVRDKKTGTSRGFCFLAYEDQRSTTLAVDNANGMKLLGRDLRVDHCKNYNPPQELDEEGEQIEANEYKPTGAEGGGLGVYLVTEQEKMKDKQKQEQRDRSRKLQLLQMNRNAVNGGKDVDEMWAEEFEMMFKRMDEEAMHEYEYSKYLHKLKKKKKKEKKKKTIREKRNRNREISDDSACSKQKKEKKSDNRKSCTKANDDSDSNQNNLPNHQ